MKLSAVICEYNPFHNGHAYQLDKAARRSDGVICVMSGDFVQRAEPAVCDKYVRAECALRSGASMVVELPVSVSAAVGERFAFGAVEIVSKLSDVRYLYMGCETDRPSVLETLADVQLAEDDDFKAELKKCLEKGVRYAQGYATSTVKRAVEAGIDPTMSAEVLSKPNNLLCISYMKALKRLGSDIKPILLPRKGNDYNDTRLGEYASATAIRAFLDRTDIARKNSEHADSDARAYSDRNDIVRMTMPPACADLFLNAVSRHPVDYKLYRALVVDAIRRIGPQGLAALPDVAEGLEHKLYKNAMQYTDLETVLNETKSKRYTYSRLKRICLYALLSLQDCPTRSRILGIREDFAPYLSTLNDSFYVQTSQLRAEENLNERRADALYTLLTNTDGNRFYSQRLVTV